MGAQSSPHPTWIGSPRNQSYLKTTTPVRCRVCRPATTCWSGHWTSPGVLGAQWRFGRTQSLLRYAKLVLPRCWCQIILTYLNAAARTITLILMLGNTCAGTKTIRGRRVLTLRGLAHRPFQLMNPDVGTSSTKTRVHGLSQKKISLVRRRCRLLCSGL